MVAIATPVAWQRGHEICNSWPHISETQRSINFKIGTYVQHELSVTWPKFGGNQRSRSHWHIMYTAEMCLAQYWVIISTSYLSGNIWAYPQLFLDTNCSAW